MVKKVSDVVNQPPTFTSAPNGWTIPATPTDMVTIRNPSAKIVRILAIIINGTQTTAGINKFFLIKRSALDTGGTAVADGVIANDSSDIATVVVEHWTANPAVLGATGGGYGTIAAEILLCPAPADKVMDRIIWIFAGFPYGSKELLLKTATEELAINFGGVALPAGLSINIEILYTEE